MSTPIQTVEGLRHVQDQNVELEHGIRNDKVENVDILTSRHKTSSVECYFVRFTSQPSNGDCSWKDKGRGDNVPSTYRPP